MAEIPKEMMTMVVTSPGNGTAVRDVTVEIKTVPVPVPKRGEVLVKVAAAPINPSDYGSWYLSSAKAYPMNMGNEGCGIVVASGGGLSTYRVPVGTPVGFLSKGAEHGAYSEYIAVSAIASIFPMPEDVIIEDCCSFFVNPYTAVAILDTAVQALAAEGKQCKSIVHTAAASQLGQMLVKLAPRKGIEIINVVRRQEQKELLEGLGAEHVIVTSGDESVWKKTLQSKIKELDCMVAFDAVSGVSTGNMLAALPPKGTVFLYGGLAGEVVGVNPMDMIYRQKKLSGFLLNKWIKNGGTISMVQRMLSAGAEVNEGLQKGGWSSSQFEDTTPEKAMEDLLKLLDGQATNKKLRIRFS
mmetsp:Transcript_22913/g.54042  ORF Transcript_22913/g.54042 Transcript_22913/m.54042 type:complete len:355 (-) Transcript_22913:53-1117(-)